MNLREDMLGYCDNANNWELEQIQEQRANKTFEGFELIKLKDAVKIAEKHINKKIKTLAKQKINLLKENEKLMQKLIDAGIELSAIGLSTKGA